MIYAIDPGTARSAWAILGDDLRPLDFGIEDNESLLCTVHRPQPMDFVIEMVACYGMAAGKDLFETAVWIGRFWEAAEGFRSRSRIYRMEEKMDLCHDSRAKDANIRQALIDRFGPVGTKQNPGWFYGVSKDVWSAIAVGVTWADTSGRSAITIKEGEAC